MTTRRPAQLNHDPVISLAHDDGRLRFTVMDDGGGFDTGATARGTGLQGMADRVAAVGGRLTVRSDLGTGTTVTGELAADARP